MSGVGSARNRPVSGRYRALGLQRDPLQPGRSTAFSAGFERVERESRSRVALPCSPAKAGSQAVAEHRFPLLWTPAFAGEQTYLSFDPVTT